MMSPMLPLPLLLRPVLLVRVLYRQMMIMKIYMINSIIC